MSFRPDRHTTIVSVEPTHCVAHWNNVMITFWHAAIDRAVLQKTMEATRKLLVTYPEGIHSLGFIEHGAPMPSPETREVAVELMNLMAGKLRSEAIVISGDGFWAGAIRSVVMGFKVFSRSNHPQKVFAQLEEAVVWQSQFIDGVTDASRLLEEAQGLRELGRKQPVPEGSFAAEG